MKSTNIRYAPEIKLSAVIRLISGKATLIELSREIGCHPTILRDWKDKLTASAPLVFGAPKDKEKDRKIEELERLIGKLTVQNEFLKKVYGSAASR